MRTHYNDFGQENLTSIYHMRFCREIIKNFQYSTSLTLFILHAFFKKNLSGIPSQCQTVWIQIRPDILLGLIWVQTICKGYQQMTKVATSGERVKVPIMTAADINFYLFFILQRKQVLIISCDCLKCKVFILFYFFFLFFIANKSWHFMWTVCQADNSHVISRLIFSEN